MTRFDAYAAGMVGTNVVRVLLAISPWLPLARAQQQVPVVGRVFDQLGAPAAGARVQVSLRTVADDVAPPHRQVTTTDAQGQFSVRVQPGFAHSIFAVHAIGTHVSPLAEGVVLGRPIELRLTQVLPKDLVAIDPLTDWTAIGPFRIEASPAAVNPFWSPLRRNEPPRLPGPVWLQVIDGNNQVVHRAAWTPGRSLTMPPPRTLQVLVQDQDGKPIGNASVAHQLPALPTPAAVFDQPEVTSWRVAATTDATGLATFLVPDPSHLHPQPAIVRIAAPGRMPILLRTDGKRLFPHPKDQKPDEPLAVVLGPVASLQVARRGEAVPGAQVRLLANGFGANRVTELVVATTDQNGLMPLAMPALATETMLRIDVGGEPPAFLRIPPWSPGQTMTAELAGLRPAAWQLLDEHNQPLAGIQGTLVACGSMLAPSLPANFHTDPFGQFRCLLGVDAWLVAFRDGERGLAVDIETAANMRSIVSGALVVPPLPRAHLVVRAGKDPAPAGTALAAGTWRATSEPVHILRTLRREVAGRCDHRYLRQHPLTTDAAGLVSIPLLSQGTEGPSVFVLRGAAQHGPWQPDRDRETVIDIGR
ncbi:MAG: hypothetical protein IPK26_00525 [Planctomycetes bacterium]|nr:hypothetical protein [Planctomycetota bacterium]